MLAEERDRWHKLPALPHTVCFGQTRKVSWQSTISVGDALYSVPSTLVDERVWARADGSELVVVHADGPDGPREVTRHQLTTPGRPSIQDEHYPPRPAGALERRPRARSAEEQAFLAIGPGAERWLIAAAAVGTTKLRRKVAEATALARLAVHLMFFREAALALAQPLGARLRDRLGLGGAPPSSRRLASRSQPRRPLRRRQLGWRLVAAAVAEALVLGPVDRVRLGQDLLRDLVVVEVLVLRGVGVNLGAVHRQHRHPTRQASAQSASTSPN
jgi:Mu transposase, C-terminal domain